MSRGHDRERAIKAILESYDWLVVRTAGSLGPVDLMCVHIGWHRALLVEAKSTAGGPYERFGPKDRQEMLEIARHFDCRCALAWWPPRKRLQWIPPVDWPKPDPEDAFALRARGAGVRDLPTRKA